MQSTVECPVCMDFYVPRIRVPKTLGCGHGVCEPCVRSLLPAVTGTTVKCPTCRTNCTIPDRKVEKLPTNFSIFKFLESLCGDCRDRQHTQRCDHCPLNVCDVCKEIHQKELTTYLTDDIRKMKQAMDNLNDIIPGEDEFKRIEEQGDFILEKLTKDYDKQRRQLEDTYQKNITAIKAEIQQNLDRLLEWKINSKRLYVDCETIVDRLKYQKQQKLSNPKRMSDPSNQQELKLKLESLKQMKYSKPTQIDMMADQLNKFVEMNSTQPTPSLSCETQTDYFFNIISNKPSMSHETQTDAVIISTPVQVPDFSAASYKAKFDHQLAWPLGICTNPNTGHVIATDLDRHEVVVLSADLQLVRRFGAKGRGADKYDSPWGVAVSDGHLCICDQCNERIHVTDLQGKGLNVFGSHGKERKHFDRPCDLSSDSAGLLYICDAGNKRIKVTDRRGAFVNEFGRKVFDGEPWYNAVSTDGRIAVTTNKHTNIYVFSISGEHITTIKTAQHKIRTSGIAFDDHGHLLVVDRAGDRVAVMKETGDVVCFIGSPGTNLGQLKDPKSVAVTGEGDVIVSDVGNKRIQLFNIPKKLASF